MRPRSLSIPAALAALLLAAGLTASQANAFYENSPYIGVNPGLNDWAVCSAWEQPLTSTFRGLFADWFNRTQQGGINTGGAMDANPQTASWRYQGTPPAGQIFPTGDLCITKISPAGVPMIETYANVNNTHIATEINNQDLATRTPPITSWITLAASGAGSVILASDIAGGYVNAFLGVQRSQHLITAEMFGGTLHLGAYALTDVYGLPVQPYLVNALNTGIQASCLGLTTCNGLALGSGTLSGNVIVFVDSSMLVHAVTFDALTAAFGQLDQTGVYTTPWPLPGSTIRGIWIAQNRQFGGAHDVGISIPAAQPGPGTFAVLRQTPLSTLVYAGVGGGPICHLPYGSPGGPAPAQWPFSANPAGWYVVTPGAGSARWSIAAFNTSSSSPSPWFGYLYPIGAQANGTPLSHPTAIGVAGNPNLRKGLLWVPWTIAPSTYQIDMIEGVLFGTYASFSHAVPAQNHLPPPTLPPLPKAGLTWPGTVIIPDQKTNYKCEYGLGQQAGLIDY